MNGRAKYDQRVTCSETPFLKIICKFNKIEIIYHRWRNVSLTQEGSSNLQMLEKTPH